MLLRPMHLPELILICSPLGVHLVHLCASLPVLITKSPVEFLPLLQGTQHLPPQNARALPIAAQ